MGDGTLTVADRFDRIERQLDTVITLQTKQAARGQADLQRFESHEKRIAALESWQTWITRLVLGTVVTAILSGLAWVTL